MKGERKHANQKETYINLIVHGVTQGNEDFIFVSGVNPGS